MEITKQLIEKAILLQSDYFKQNGDNPSRRYFARKLNINEQAARSLLVLIKYGNLLGDKNTKLMPSELTSLHAKLTEYKKEIEILDKLGVFTKSLKNRTTDVSKFTVEQKHYDKEECTAFSMFSDSHVEERVDRDVVLNLNEYTPDVSKIRINKYFKRLAYLIKKYRNDVKIDNLVLGLLGDNITGYIHEEYEQTNFMSPIEATLFVQELLIKGLKFLSEDCGLKQIIVPCIRGNHGRTTNKKQYANNYAMSYEWLMYKNIENFFSAIGGYDNIHFIINKSEFTYVTVYDKINVFSHGDSFNYKDGIGGITIPLNKKLLNQNTVLKFDMAWMGHWHNYLCGSNFRINGSVIGYTPFSMGHFFPYEPPKQQFQLLNPRRGFTSNEPIYLNEF